MIMIGLWLDRCGRAIAVIGLVLDCDWTEMQPGLFSGVI